jgi:hypothetical protein
VLAVGVLGVLVSCGLPAGDLDGGTVERDVAAEFEERDGVGLELDCPEDMPVASGEVHLCHGTTSDGAQVTVGIQISDDLDGSYEWWDVAGPIRTATPEPRPGG